MNTRAKMMVTLSTMGLALLAFSSGCSSDEGVAGDTPIDCGEHGTAHDGHCHCDTGFLYDGTTCVAPEAITNVCEEHDEDAGTEHHHGACLCPSTGTCPCEGTVESIAGKDYCVPDLHAE
jgi:hypothetical protein